MRDNAVNAEIVCNTAIVKFQISTFLSILVSTQCLRLIPDHQGAVGGFYYPPDPSWFLVIALAGEVLDYNRRKDAWNRRRSRHRLRQLERL